MVQEGTNKGETRHESYSYGGHLDHYLLHYLYFLFAWLGAPTGTSRRRCPESSLTSSSQSCRRLPAFLPRQKVQYRHSCKLELIYLSQFAMPSPLAILLRSHSVTSLEKNKQGQKPKSSISRHKRFDALETVNPPP